MAEEKRGLLSFLGAGRSINITTGEGDAGSGRFDPPPAGGTLVDTAYLTTLVGQGRITLTQKAQILNGTLTPEQLVALNIISSNEFAALTGQVYGGTAATGAAVAWTSALAPADGQLVVYNGSLYQAIGSPAAGTIPPVEIAAPANSLLGARYRLLARGRSEVVAWDSAGQYFRDQVVTYIGGRYRCEAASATKGSAPCIDSSEWIAEFQGMTSREQAPLSAGVFTAVSLTTGVTGIYANVTSVQVKGSQTNDTPRVKRFDLALVNSGTASGAGSTLCTITFPIPFPVNKGPGMRLTPQSAHAGARGLALVPVVDGLGRCTGCSLVNGLATVAADTIGVHIEIDENLGQ